MERLGNTMCLYNLFNKMKYPTMYMEHDLDHPYCLNQKLSAHNLSNYIRLKYRVGIYLHIMMLKWVCYVAITIYKTLNMKQTSLFYYYINKIMAARNF